MSTSAASLPRPSYLSNGYSLKSWLLTRDHKRIAILYLISITLFFVLGGIFALLIRLELLTPEGDLLQPDTYNRMFTMHGIIMVFFFLIPSVPAVLGNFLVPIMIGAKDLAFPRINLASWYLYMIGGITTLVAVLIGGVDTGWTFYTPFCTTFSNSYVMLTIVGIFIAGFSSIFTGLNFIVTIHRMRAPGMTWFRLPLFIWSHYATSLIIVLGTPVVAITLALVAVERTFHLGIFDPALGGDPVLFQHLFWFYSHPAVYIMILPAMGVVSELIAAFARKQVFGYHFVAFASLAIAVLGFLVWGHHMFVSGQSVYAATVFSVLSMLVAIPSAVKVFNWTATLYQGSISRQTPMLYALGFIGLFTIGGLTGVLLATLGIDVHVTDTYFVVAHFHYIMVGGTIMGYLGGLHYWWPKMTGRMYPELLVEALGDDHLRRLQPDLLPPVHPRLPGHAAPLLGLPAGVPGAQRAVHRRRLDPRRRLPAAADLLPLVAQVRTEGRRQPVGRRRPGVGDHLAAADRELRRDAGGDLRPLRLLESGGSRWLT